MFRYAFEYLGEGREFMYGFAWALVAFVVFGASLALGIVGPSLVQVGNAAPVRPEMAYFPDILPNPTAVLKVFGIRASSYLRALGSVEAADVTTRKEINIRDDTNLPDWKGPNNSSEPMYRLNYTYSITGNSLGLQHGSDLAVDVSGSCITEYGWYDASQGRNENDVYNLWGNKSMAFGVPLDVSSIRNAPKASFVFHPQASSQRDGDGKVQFSAIVWSAHRSSISGGRDAWYTTEPGNQTYNVPFQAKYWVKRGRPALSCWQQDRWRYGTQSVKSVHALKDLPGIKIPLSLLDVLAASFDAPKLPELGNACGDSALRSRTTSPNGVIDAEASTIKGDLERLILASYVASQSIFIDTTMMGDRVWKNVLRGDTGGPRAGAGDFVIVSPEIQTFSTAGLITIIVCLASLLIIESGITALIHLHHRATKPAKKPPGDNSVERPGDNPDEPPAEKTNKWILFKVLSALALFRRIYEPPETLNDPHWHCIRHFPDETDPTEFSVRGCGTRPADPCKGHIVHTLPSQQATDPPAGNGVKSEQQTSPQASPLASPMASPIASQHVSPPANPTTTAPAH